MITRHHLVLSLLLSLILCSSFLVTRPILAILVCTGVCIGSLLPDIHMSRPKKTGPRTLAWVLVQLPRKACAGFLIRIYAVLNLRDIDPEDKCVTHSFPGILFLTACSALVLLLPAYIISPSHMDDISIFLFGLFLGMVFHLIEDICTRKGVFLFFPLSRKQIAGSIRPCDQDDHRIRRFHVQHGGMLLFLLVLESTGILGPALALPASLAGIALCIGIMLYSSDVAFRESASPMVGYSRLRLLGQGTYYRGMNLHQDPGEGEKK